MVEFKDFDDGRLYHHCDYSIVKNKINILIGDNGSGKSTLIFYLLGIYGGYEGDILFDGVDINLCENIKNDVKVVFQNPYLQFIGYTVSDELLYHFEQINEQNVDMTEIANKFGGGDTLLKDLSGGQAQILNLESILLQRPKLLIIDEAFSNLSDDVKLGYVSRFNELNITVLLITNNLLDCKYGDVIYNLENKKFSKFDYEQPIYNLLPNDSRFLLQNGDYKFNNGFNVLVGESGVGKSYLLNDIFYNNNVDSRLVTQYPFLQVYYLNIKELLIVHSIDMQQYIDLVESFGYNADIINNDCVSLSTGELTLLIILVYFLIKPTVLLLDEAIEVIDSAKQFKLLSLLSSTNVIFVSHNLKLFNNYKVNIVEVKNV